VQELLAGHTAITVGVKDWNPYSTDIIKVADLPRPSYEDIVAMYNKEEGE
jgi:hypothetical protein